VSSEPKSGVFGAADLVVVRPAPLHPRDFWLGDVVHLRSGGPAMVVVDTDAPHCSVSWREGPAVHELSVPAICLEYAFLETS